MLEARSKYPADDMKEIKSDLKTMHERLARMEGEISRLPGYLGIAAVVGIIVALSTAAQIAASFFK